MQSWDSGEVKAMHLLKLSLHRAEIFLKCHQFSQVQCNPTLPILDITLHWKDNETGITFLKKVLNTMNNSPVHSKPLRFYCFPYSVYFTKWTASSPLSIGTPFLLSCLKLAGEFSDGGKNKIEETRYLYPLSSLHTSLLHEQHTFQRTPQCCKWELLHK